MTHRSWKERNVQLPDKHRAVYVKLRDGNVYTATYMGSEDWIFSETSMKKLNIDSIHANNMFAHQIEKWRY